MAFFGFQPNRTTLTQLEIINHPNHLQPTPDLPGHPTYDAINILW